jgi:hypothetical protein
MRVSTLLPRGEGGGGGGTDIKYSSVTVPRHISLALVMEVGLEEDKAMVIQGLAKFSFYKIFSCKDS